MRTRHEQQMRDLLAWKIKEYRKAEALPYANSLERTLRYERIVASMNYIHGVLQVLVYYDVDVYTKLKKTWVKVFSKSMK